MKFRVLTLADGEAIAAALWYEDRKPGLADVFLEEMRVAFEAIQSHPLALPPLMSYSGSHHIRRCLMNQFPYAVIFLCRPEEIVVVAIAHMHRRPFYWLDRLSLDTV